MDAIQAPLIGSRASNSPASSTWRNGGPALAVMTAGAVQLAVTCASLLTAAPAALLARYTADDAFYYFDIARNFPRVQATTGITTTGFHPPTDCRWRRSSMSRQA